MLTKSHSMAGALLENHCLLRCLRRAFLASSCDRGGTLEDTDRKVTLEVAQHIYTCMYMYRWTCTASNATLHTRDLHCLPLLHTPRKTEGGLEQRYLYESNVQIMKEHNLHIHGSTRTCGVFSISLP